jgi:putative SbcD/Mre11-related phosphoesterase
MFIHLSGRGPKYRSREGEVRNSHLILKRHAGAMMEAMEVFDGVRITSDLCVHLPAERTLVVADLHLGYETALEAEGIHIPRVQTRTIKEALVQAIERHGAERVGLLGDVKHEFSRNMGQEVRDVRSVLDSISDLAEIIIVKGNHDNFIENIVSRLDIPVLERFVLRGVTFVHGHRPCLDRPLVMGHEHPSVKILDKVGAYLKLPCHLVLRREGISVLPAFSPLAAGTDITGVSRSEYLSPILANSDVMNGEIYACTDIGLIPLGVTSALAELRL